MKCLAPPREGQIIGILDRAKLRARRASNIEWEEDSGAVRQLEIQER